MHTLVDRYRQDPHVFRPPGSGSVSQRNGSGSGSGYFYDLSLSKISKKNLDSTVLCLLFDFLS